MQSKAYISVDNQFIIGNLYISDIKSAIGFLFIHGWRSSDKKYIPLAKKCSQKGLVSLTLNLRGHMNSPFPLKDFSREDHLYDITTSIDYLNNKFNLKRIVVLGKSYGGYLAAIASMKRNIDYLILAQPALYPDEDFNISNIALLEENPDIFRSSQCMVTNNKALRAIHEFKNPILLIQSENDEKITNDIYLRYNKLISKKRNTAVFMIPGADHSLTKSKNLEDFYCIVEKWLSKYQLI